MQYDATMQEALMATRDSRSTRQSQSEAALWPYRAGIALLATFVLLILLLVVLVVMREVDALPSDRISSVLLLGAVLLSLVPVFLLVLDRVRASAGSFEAPGGIKVSFARAEVSARVDVARTTISANLGGASSLDVAESGGAILRTLKPALGSEVAIVDLGEGQEWWQTRLLVLVSGAARLGRPRALVFTATMSGNSGRFVAWATPRDMLRVHLQTANPGLELAYRQGQARVNRWALAEPEVLEPSKVTYPWAPDTPQPEVDNPRSDAPSQLVPELIMLEKLATVEPPNPNAIPDLAVTVQVLRALFTPVLREKSVDRSDDDALWRDATLGGTDEYLAVTDRGAYAALVSRQAAINALLRSLVPALDVPLSRTDKPRSQHLG